MIALAFFVSSLIAKEVGITKPALYYYFSSKEDLFYALLQAVCDEIRFEKFFVPSTFTATNFKDHLIECGLKMIQEQRTDPNYSLLMREFMIQSVRDEKIMAAVSSVIDTYVKGFEALLEQGGKLGVIDREDIRVKAEMLTMVTDQIDNYMILGVAFDFEGLWRFTVNQL